MCSVKVMLVISTLFEAWSIFQENFITRTTSPTSSLVKKKWTFSKVGYFSKKPHYLTYSIPFQNVAPHQCCASSSIFYRILDRRTWSRGMAAHLVWKYGTPGNSLICTILLWEQRFAGSSPFMDLKDQRSNFQMNFTNISRALQACEHITIAGVRLWKRRKQGEYSFFPCYTGHG